MDWQCQKGEVLPPEPPHPFKSFSLKRNWLAVKIWNAEGKVSGIRFKKKSILWNRKEIKQLIPSWMKIEFGDEENHRMWKRGENGKIRKIQYNRPGNTANLKTAIIQCLTIFAF